MEMTPKPSFRVHSGKTATELSLPSVQAAKTFLHAGLRNDWGGAVSEPGT